MIPDLTGYLASIKDRSRLEGPDEKGVMSEIEAHLDDKLQDLIASGLSEAEAAKACLRQMGNTGLVARRIYEAHSQGTWPQALLAMMPHLLFGLLFFLNWWHYPGWLSLVIGLTLVTTVYGWWRGKPAWVFSWLGYTLLPVIILGIMLLYLPDAWSLLVLVIYLPAAMWWLLRLIAKTTGKDWLFSSLMLLPLPIFIGWFLAVFPGGRLTAAGIEKLSSFAPWIGFSFIALALTIAVFIRLRQRGLRIGLMAASGLLTLTLVVYYTNGRLDMLTFLGLTLVMWGVLLVPPLLERYIRNGIYTENKTGVSGR
jgi:hypothetical protein